MKKTYSKPEILFEDFSVRTSIASCERELSFAQNTCGVKFGSYVIFTTEGICNRAPEIPDEYDGYCYHIPSEDRNFFSS